MRQIASAHRGSLRSSSWRSRTPGVATPSSSWRLGPPSPRQRGQRGFLHPSRSSRSTTESTMSRTADEQTAGEQTAGEQTAWSSGLSSKDFAGCVEAGFEPLGFVQGCSVISWNWYGTPGSMTGFGPSNNDLRSGYYEQFDCPHGYVSMEHRGYGCNYEQTWIGQSWS